MAEEAGSAGECRGGVRAPNMARKVPKGAGPRAAVGAIRQKRHPKSEGPAAPGPQYGTKGA
ncbi:hypothetical protein J2S03_003271 [Alicyclobacillus cycloheptanicus]|uniref:Uncharacterized protein n=1 Tax=Alicyclobacillus cycloheptanicus TaxID=1457 RepID=A0ABT9XM85_9BACL|nr:hypothetical protein [Alicyclobacillus cycloheptanicus]